MTGETDLARLIATMTPVLAPEVLVFATTTDAALAHSAPALMRFTEAEGTTLILTAEAAADLGLAAVFPCRRITLMVQSSLQAVGFIAAIAAALTRAGIGVNPVAGFHHDHLFIAKDRADDAMEILMALAARDITSPDMMA